MGHPSSYALVAAAALLGLAGVMGLTRLPLQTGVSAPARPAPTGLPEAPVPSAPLPATAALRAEPAPVQALAPGPEPGRYEAPEVPRDGAPRVYPMTRNVWVRPGPSNEDSWIGFLWFGGSVRTRGELSLPGPGCRGRFHPIEPRGYVCVDDERATLDPEHPVLRGLVRFAPNLASPWPHRYGESTGLVRYASLPSEHLQRKSEEDYVQHHARVARAQAGDTISALLGVDLRPSPEGELALPALPRTLQMGHDQLGPRSTVAWSREQASGGRSFLLAADLKWVPKDRVKPYPTVTFAGVRLGRDARLPLAFFRARDRPAFTLLAGDFMPSARVFPRLSWVELTGHRERRGEQVYLETREPGLYVLESDAVVPTPAAAAAPSSRPADAARRASSPRATRVEVSILGGWLIAYEGDEPVFATLVSSGRGGAAAPGQNAVAMAATPTGRFSINGKFSTATMSNGALTHSEVPWALNFSGPHALHAAYWHDRWGELQSGGCINLSPRDARFLFYELTQPQMPEGWHGVRWLPELEPSTTLVVHR